jgi:histidinol-phosphatase (PHP family)
MIDYHLHTPLCKHASGEVHEFIERALQLNISEIAFTDHIPLPENFDIDHRMTYDEMDLYQKWIEKARIKYPELKIKFGIEADYFEGFEEYLYKFLATFDFDLVIMAVHFIRHWPPGNWVFDYNFPDKLIAEVYIDYINAVKMGVRTGLFDIIGHVDMIKKSGDSLVKIIPHEIEDLLKIINKTGMAIEINTSGYRKSVHESYPGFDWLPELNRYSIPICTGSDAHKVEQIALQFNEVYKYLEDTQSLLFSRFDRRSMTQIHINQLE